MFLMITKHMLKSYEFLFYLVKSYPGLSIFFNCTSTSLFTGSTFYLNLKNFHEYLTQHSLKSGGTKDHLRQVKVPGTAPY